MRAGLCYGVIHEKCPGLTGSRAGDLHPTDRIGYRTCPRKRDSGRPPPESLPSSDPGPPEGFPCRVLVGVRGRVVRSPSLNLRLLSVFQTLPVVFVFRLKAKGFHADGLVLGPVLALRLSEVTAHRPAIPTNASSEQVPLTAPTPPRRVVRANSLLCRCLPPTHRSCRDRRSWQPDEFGFRAVQHARDVGAIPLQSSSPFVVGVTGAPLS